MPHFVQLLGLAAIDSINLLSFAVLAGLWVTMGGAGSWAYFRRAIRYTGGAFLGIAGLAALLTWVIGANQDVVRELFDAVWVMVALIVIGVVVLILGLRTPKEPDDLDSPLASGLLQRSGLLLTGVVLGIAQSATSVPYAAGMVIISFADTPIWVQVLQILFFAFVATLPCMVIIVVLTRVRSRRAAAATEYIDRFMGIGRVLGRWLTIGVGAALVVAAAVRLAQITGWL